MGSSSRLPNPQFSGYPTGASTSDLRRTATVNSRQSNQQLPPLNPPQQPTDSHDSQRKERKPDWNNFYRNGIPKEVIVIDDDDTPEPPQPAPASNQVPGPSNTTGSMRHTDKKRKTAASAAYDPVYHQHQSYSATQTPYYDHSPNKTASTDRTASAINTTAATSLGSQASNGAYLPPLDDGVVGQKRKRTRQAALDEANEAKRRELERAGDPYSAYVPPPNPPIKAKDVYVQVIPDVRCHESFLHNLYILIRQKSYVKEQKADDDDGHYIVHQEADLTDRCTCHIMLSEVLLFGSLMCDQTKSSNYLDRGLLAKSSRPSIGGKARSVQSKSYVPSRSIAMHLA